MPRDLIGHPAPKTEPLSRFPEYSDHEMAQAASAFRTAMASRRTVRHFSGRSVPRIVIETCIATANQAPSGANRQPWHFAVVGDAKVKTTIRIRAEEEERKFYFERASQEWLASLALLGTNWEKPFLETAPWLIAVFGERHSIITDSEKLTNYYVPESVCLASGFLLCALHHAGLATLTHTPSPMRFLNEILERPLNEKPYILIVTGHPAENCRVPKLLYKKPKQVTSWF